MIPMPNDDYSEVIKLLVENKTCLMNLESVVAASILSHEKDSERYFKIIIALIAMIGGILGLQLNFPATGTGVAIRTVSTTVNWVATLSNFTRYYTVFALLFTGLSIIREYWKNGYNKYLGVGFIVMSASILFQIFDVLGNLDVNALWFRLTYNTLFLIYAYNLGKKDKLEELKPALIKSANRVKQ